MNNRMRFFLAVLTGHVVAYLVAGGISYQFVTKQMWDGPDSLLAGYLRTPGSPALWEFAMIWQIPAQLIRVSLFGLVLLPLAAPLADWPAGKKLWFFSGLIFVLTHLSAAAPSPANLEGLVYMRPEYVRLGFIRMQAEMILYSVLFGCIVARYGAAKGIQADPGRKVMPR